MFNYARWALAVVCVAGTASTVSAQGKVTPTPNSQKYSNAGAKPATGRSGSASLQTRALIAKDGSMQVEASTGSVEAGSGPGEIAKVQIKIADFTKNFNGLTAGGYWSSSFPAATRGTAIQVQAGVRGIDPKRTDVVTVSTPALFRPDVAVNSVSGPASAAPQSTITFVAEVEEKNGDVGATTNCELSINGTQVNATGAIWVDAGDAVNCQFSQAFTTPGTYTIKVAAVGVTPGDWDASNNQAETTITIVEPSQPITNGYMQAEQSTYNYYHRYYRDGGYYYYSYNGERWENRDISQVYLSAWKQGGAPIVQEVKATIFRNGALDHQAAMSPNQTWSYDNGYSYNNCGTYVQDVWNGSSYAHSADRFQMCSSGTHGDPNGGSTSYYYQQFNGTVTYYGWEQNYYYYYGYYTWNQHDTYGSGTSAGWNANDVIRLKIDFTDASGTAHTADRSVTLNDRSGDVNQNYEYWWYDYWYYGGYYYDRVIQSGVRYFGDINWNQ